MIPSLRHICVASPEGIPAIAVLLGVGRGEKAIWMRLAESCSVSAGCCSCDERGVELKAYREQLAAEQRHKSSGVEFPSHFAPHGEIYLDLFVCQLYAPRKVSAKSGGCSTNVSRPRLSLWV